MLWVKESAKCGHNIKKIHNNTNYLECSNTGKSKWTFLNFAQFHGCFMLFICFLLCYLSMQLGTLLKSLIEVIQLKSNSSVLHTRDSRLPCMPAHLFTISQNWKRIILNKSTHQLGRVAMPMHFLETQSFEAMPHFMHSLHLWDNSLPRPSIWQSPSFIVIFCSSFVRTARMDVSHVQGNSGTSCSAGPRVWREYARLHHPVSRLTETQRNWTYPQPNSRDTSLVPAWQGDESCWSVSSTNDNNSLVTLFWPLNATTVSVCLHLLH